MVSEHGQEHQVRQESAKGDEVEISSKRKAVKLHGAAVAQQGKQ